MSQTACQTLCDPEPACAVSAAARDADGVPAVAALDPAALQLIVRTLGLGTEEIPTEDDAAADAASGAVAADKAGADAGESQGPTQRVAEERDEATAGKRAGAAALRKAEVMEAASAARAAPRNRQLLVDWAESSGRIKLPVRMLQFGTVRAKVNDKSRRHA